ncbi:hypothetical protein BC834DRAFT_174288 [Gloeopeniophorella convolvens]|nr:hypothetical protein BC834DRAFT_174288 [Gloeopeniophorella convolvens]
MSSWRDVVCVVAFSVSLYLCNPIWARGPAYQCAPHFLRNSPPLETESESLTSTRVDGSARRQWPHLCPNSCLGKRGGVTGSLLQPQSDPVAQRRASRSSCVA